jgi:hypothetical protein
MKYICLLSILCFCACKKSGSPANSALTYQLRIERGLVNGAPEFVDSMTVTMSMHDSVIDIVRDSVQYTLIKHGGELTPSNPDSTVPTDVVMLAALPMGDLMIAKGATDSSHFPSNARVAAEDDKIALQDYHSYTYADSTSAGVQLRQNSHFSFIKNSRFKREYGAAADTMNRYYARNLFASGTATYDASKKAVSSFDVHFILFPIVGLADSNLMNSKHSDHATFTLQ